MSYWEHCRVVGAAILPFCVDPECGRLFFWLGKERYNAKWARGSEMWACFGGRPLHKSEPPESIAAREFVEETAGMLMYFPTDVLPRASHVDIAQSLTDQDFLFRIVFGVASGGHITPVSSSPASVSSRSAAAAVKSIYVMFVKQIHWDPHAARRFKACMNVMNKLPEVVKDVRRREWLLEHPAIHLKKPQMAAAADGKHHLAAHVSISKHPCIPACRRMCYMQQQHYLEQQPEYEPESTEHHHLVVDKDYVEKQEIALWSVPQMQRATRSNGVLTTRNGNVERCRTTFTKQIVAVLAELSFYEPAIFDERV